jgi:uncharacterized protein YqgC (DUF456 family)
MDTLLHVLGLSALLAVCLLALVSLLFGLPGTFLIVAAALVYAWATGFASVHWSTIGWLTALALIGEGIEFAAGAAAAAGTRPTRRVTVAALAGGFVGGIAGTPILFGLGSLLGALAGAFVGAALAVASEGGSLQSAFTTGLAALRGRLLGFILKAAIAVVMLIWLAATVL